MLTTFRDEWSDIIYNIVKFMVSSEAREHDMMTRLYNMNVMSRNVVSIRRLYFATIFRIHPSLRYITLDLSYNLKIVDIFFFENFSIFAYSINFFNSYC